MHCLGTRSVRCCLAISLIVSCFTSIGCDAYLEQQRRKQLEMAAKDWCYTIRASQVIPVYPLSEDVQVGDVFLVHMPAEKQHEEYKNKGFLPLEQLIVRLQPKGYHKFYLDSHDTKGRKDIPHHWKFKNKPDTSVKAEGKEGAETTVIDREDNWYMGPMAGFPSYGFDIKQGQGFSLAVPIEGIPVAMSLLGAQSAHCNVTIKDAYTYGIGTLDLERQVRRWARRNPDFLESFKSKKAEGFLWTYEPKEQFYLRVVTRVYLAKEFNVSVTTTSSVAAGITAGLKPPASTPPEPTSQPAENLKNILEAMNEGLASGPTIEPGSRAIVRDAKGKIIDVKFGASLRVVSASGRSISMKQTFNRPLAIGYIAIDLPIMDDGNLGRRVSTLATLEKKRSYQCDSSDLPLSPKGKALFWVLLRDIYKELESRKETDPRADKIVNEMEKLGKEISNKLPFTMYVEDDTEKALGIEEETNGFHDIKSKGFVRVIDYRNYLRKSIEILDSVVRLKPEKFMFNKKPATKTDIKKVKRELTRQRRLEAEFIKTYGRSKAMMNGLDYYYDLLRGLGETGK